MTNKRLGMMEKYHTSIHNSTIARVIYIQDQELEPGKRWVILRANYSPLAYPMLQISVFCEHFEIIVFEKLNCSWLSYNEVNQPRYLPEQNMLNYVFVQIRRRVRYCTNNYYHLSSWKSYYRKTSYLRQKFLYLHNFSYQLVHISSWDCDKWLLSVRLKMSTVEMLMHWQPSKTGIYINVTQAGLVCSITPSL